MKPPARLALISSYSPSLVTFRGSLIQSLVGAGFSVRGFGPEADDAVIAELLRWGASFRSYRLQRAGMNPFQDLVSYRDLLRELRAFRPQVVLSYTVKPVVYGSLAARMVETTVIASMITGLGFALMEGRRTLASRVTARLLRTSLRFNDLVFVYNSDIERTYRDRGILSPKNRVVEVAGSGVDLSRYPRIPVPQGPPTFLLLARLLRDKGIAEFAKASQILKAQYPDTRCILAGPFDPNPAALSPAEVDQWVRQGWVEYVGAVDDVRPLLAECSVYVLPSYAEGIPRSVLEAMATGRAVITTDAPGCRETVEHGGNGFLVPPRDPIRLARAMQQFLMAPGLVETMGRESRRLVEARFDARDVNSCILSALSEVGTRKAEGG